MPSRHKIKEDKGEAINEAQIVPTKAKETIFFTETPKEKKEAPKGKKPSKDNASLTDQIDILEDPASTEQQKIDALITIAGIFINSPSGISQSQVTATLQAIGDHVLGIPGSQLLIYYGFYAISRMFSSNVQMTIADAEQALDIVSLSIPSDPGYYDPSNTFYWGLIPAIYAILGRKLLSTERLEQFANDLIDLVESETDVVVKAGITRLAGYPLSVQDTDFDQSFLSSFVYRLQTILNSAETDDVKIASGGIITQCYFLDTSFFDTSNGALFNIPSTIGDAMKANSPDWLTIMDYVHRTTERDYEMIYKIATAHPNEQIIKTIFESTGITYFGQFTQQQLEHFYYDKDTPTGKPLFFGVLTTHKGNVDFMSEFRGDDINNNYDVRFIQPGTTENLVDLLEQTADRLGVQPKDIDPSGQKFKVFVMLAHGIRTSAGWLKEGEPDWDLPEYFNSTDTQEITEIGKYFDNARAYFKECSPAGDWQDNTYNGFNPYNIAETLGEYAGMKVWGAQWSSTGPSAVYGMDGADYTVLDVTYGNIARNSYDYINTSSLSLSSWSATKTGTVVNLAWGVQDLSNTIGYDVERSTDGLLFERVGLVPANPKGEKITYSFTDESAPEGDIFYRIKQRNATAYGTNGSMDYTFAFSEAKKVKDLTSNLSQTEQAGIELNFAPNPFLSTATVSFNLPQDSLVKIALYDISGKEVATLVDEKHVAGKDEVRVDAATLGLAPGIYICTMEVDGSIAQSKKIVLMK